MSGLNIYSLSICKPLISFGIKVHTWAQTEAGTVKQ